MIPRSWSVPAALSGVRLDRALASLCEGVSRSELSRWIEEGRVTIDGATRTRPAEKVREGAVIVARPLPPPPSDAKPDPSVVFRVVHEDAAIVVVDKPAGLVVHPSKGHATGTLVNGLLAHASIEAEDDDAAAAVRPGIVHRIDKGTSGLLVIAKTAIAREALKSQFAAHSIERVYDAVAVGVLPDRATYDTLYGRHPTDRKAFSSKVREGKRAVTHVQVVERLVHGTLSRVECRLETGRTHQIRVHLADHGAPLLGDPIYGKPPKDPAVRAIGESLGRQALHARVLGFVHPTTRKKMRFEAPWPVQLVRAIEALRAI